MIGDIHIFRALVRERCGLMLEGNGEATLRSALTARMAATGHAGAAAYYGQLVSDDHEFQELVCLLTINETYFFREADQLTLLVERLVPRVLAGRTEGYPVRILCAGCSTGEEPYSIAMALLEKYGDTAARMVSIIAGDIDHKALDRARMGHYGVFSFRGVSAELSERYFTPVGRQMFAMADSVRDMVTFHHMNLLSPHQPDHMSGMDIILFRNVSIYFDTPTRRMIQKNLCTLLQAEGALMVGTAETLANDLGVFRLVEEDGLFYFAKGGSLPSATGRQPATVVPMAPVARPPVSRAPASRSAVARAPASPAVRPPPRPRTVSPQSVPVVTSVDLEPVRILLRDKKYQEARAGLAGILAVAPDMKDALLLDACAKAHARDFEAAEVQARRVLDLDEWSVEAFVLLGFIARWRDDIDAAILWFKQAVYARHDCWVAQYYLAEVCRAGGQDDLARRAYRIALQHLGGDADPDGGLALPLGLPMAEVRFLCERHAGLNPGVAAAAAAGGR